MTQLQRVPSIQPLPADDILTPQELAARLKLPLSWIYEKTRQSNSDPLPVLRCGRYLRFSWREVCAWLRRS